MPDKRKKLKFKWVSVRHVFYPVNEHYICVDREQKAGTVRKGQDDFFYSAYNARGQLLGDFTSLKAGKRRVEKEWGPE